MSVIRLHPDRTPWGLYGVFENRVRQVMAEHAGLSERQSAVALAQIRERFVRDPLSAGYFLVRRARPSEAIAHACCWVQYEWGQPYVHVWQLKKNDGAAPGVGRLLIDAAGKWIGEVNQFLEHSAAPTRIAYLEFVTPKADEWAKFLEHYGERPTRVCQVVRYEARG